MEGEGSKLCKLSLIVHLLYKTVIQKVTAEVKGDSLKYNKEKEKIKQNKNKNLPSKTKLYGPNYWL